MKLKIIDNEACKNDYRSLLKREVAKSMTTITIYNLNTKQTYTWTKIINFRSTLGM